MNDPRRNVISLVIDGLHIGFLGAYGNSRVETPAFDALATRSVLFDRYYANSTNLNSFYASCFAGVHPSTFRWNADPAFDESTVLPVLYEKSGYRTVLLTDVSEVAQNYGSFFQDVRVLEIPRLSSPVESLEETHFFRFLAQFVDAISEFRDDSSDVPLFLWGHSSGFRGVWDFPLSVRESFVDDENDPVPYSQTPPPSFVATDESRNAARRFGDRREPEVESNSFKNENLNVDSPDSNLTGDLNSDDESILNVFGPDRIQSVQEAYFAGVSLLDETLDGLSRFLDDERYWDDSCFILTSNRGFPLGWNDRVGDVCLNLYAEELRLPLLIRYQNDWSAGVRSSRLVDPCDLYQTALGWLSLSDDFSKIPNSNDEISKSADSQATEFVNNPTWGYDLTSILAEDSPEIRPYLLTVENDADSQNRVVITEDWFLRRTISANRCNNELFVLPDDRWNVNEVADRCEEELERLISLSTRPVLP